MTHASHRDLAFLFARIALGVVFVAHGWQKYNDLGVAGVEVFFTNQDVPLPNFAAHFSTYLELGGGILLILGAFTPLVGLLLFVNMLGAFLFVHIFNGVFVANNGYELVAALGAGALVLAVVGPGRFSVDQFIAQATKGRIPGYRL
jgi:putative oxidoreductase